MAFRFDAPENRKKKVNNAEKQFAKKHKGFRQPCSGAISGFKGDVKFEDFLVDLKSTDMNSFRITLADLQKIQAEADGQARDPAIVVVFNNCKNFENEWAVVPLSTLKGD